MGKYDRLGAFLRDQQNQFVPITFSEIERLLGVSLPASSRYPAWWSNNPTNNVMTKIWLGAGFKTEQVDTTAKKLVFRRTRLAQENLQARQTNSRPAGSGLAEPPRIFNPKHHPLFGALKGIVRIAGKTDLTKPADSDWSNA